MRIRYLLLLIVMLPFITLAQSSQDTQPKMKTYTFVMLKKGLRLDQDSTELARIQKGHLDHLSEMAKSGDLNIAGPFLDNGYWRGILIFNTDDLEKVKKLVEADPAVISGRFSYEIHPWMTQQGASFK